MAPAIPPPKNREFLRQTVELHKSTVHNSQSELTVSSQSLIIEEDFKKRLLGVHFEGFFEG